MMQIGILLAADGDPPGPGLIQFLPFILIAFVIWWLILRPMKRQEQERQALASNLKKNDEVLTQSGMYGIVVDVSDTEDKITVKIADNVRVKMTKGSIHRNLSNEEAAKEAKSAKEVKV